VTLGNQLLILNAALSEVKAAVMILQVRAAMQMNSGNPLDGLKGLLALQRQVVESDPGAQENKEARELLDLVAKWKKEQGGGSSGQS
jgi:hypothetical protein